METVIAELASGVTAAGPVALVRLAGTLDLHTAVTLRSRLLTCLAAQPELVVVDLARMRVGEEPAVSVFAAVANHAAAWPGCAIVLCAPRPEVGSVLSRMAGSLYVPVHPSVESAVEAYAGSPPPPRLRERLAPVLGSTARVRHLIAEACQAWGLATLSDVAQLIATELVSNAVRHARTDIDISISMRRLALHISVRDRSFVTPRRGGDGSDGDRRGLLVVEALSTAWGSSPTQDGKVVWATLGQTVARNAS